MRLDYCSFGMVQPGRSFWLIGDSAYKFAFNDKLHDDEIYGKDDSYDYGARFYNTRLGRFMSVDPLFKKFPELSTYQFASNSPLWGTDLDGKEIHFVNTESQNKGPFNTADRVDASQHPFLHAYAVVADAINNVFIGPTVNAVRTLTNPNASVAQKAASVGAAIIFTPGFGDEGVPQEGDFAPQNSSPKSPTESSKANDIASNNKDNTEEKGGNNNNELTPNQKASLTRFNKKLPANASPTKVHDLPNGGKAFQSESAGKVPGSKAIYEKQVDANGKTTSFTKTTLDPKGNIVHVKDKLNNTTITPQSKH